MVWNSITTFAVFVICLMIGDVVGTKTKGILASTFLAMVLFLIGLWTGILPTNFLETAGITRTITTFALLMIIIQAGSSISIKQLISQWRTCVVALGAVAGICLLTFTVGSLAIGWERALAATPALAGGAAAATVMSNAALEIGREDASALAFMVVFTQGLVGFPIMSNLARGEIKKSLAGYRAGEIENNPLVQAAQNPPKKLIPTVPDKYNTPKMVFAKIAVIAVLGNLCSNLTNGAVNQLVFCLIFAVIATQIGFLDRNCLGAAKSAGIIGIFMYGNTVYGMIGTSFQDFLALLLPLVTILVIGIIGLALGSIVIGKLVKYSWRKSFIIGLCCLCGYPFTEMVIQEGARVNSNNDKEYEFICNTMAPDVVIGGIVAVTITSILIAGVFVNWL